jgi:hypothetical protein
MLVSMWHFSRRIRPDFELSDLLEAACEGTCLSGPIWDHVLGYWNASKASPETVLFLRYEEMLREPVGNVVKLARFLGAAVLAGRGGGGGRHGRGAAVQQAQRCRGEQQGRLRLWSLDAEGKRDVGRIT